MDIPEQSFRRYLDGDKSAFTEVLDACRERLIYFINGFVHDTGTAEDIAADVFAFLILHPEKYDFSYPLKTYLYTVARSRAIDCLRRRKRIPVLPIDDCGEMYDNTPLPEELAVANEDIALLRASIGRLCDDYRTAIQLVYFENMSCGQAAIVMKKSKKQIENLLYRAKKAIRADMEGRTGGEAAYEKQRRI